MEFDPNTGMAPDGTMGPSALKHSLACERIKTQFHIEALEADLAQVVAKNPAAVKDIREAIKAGYKKLERIDNQAKAEQERLNKQRFPERSE